MDGDDWLEVALAWIAAGLTVLLVLNLVARAPSHIAAATVSVKPLDCLADVLGCFPQ